MKQTEKRKEWLREYRKTDKYKNRMREYRRKWVKTENGKASARKNREKILSVVDLHKDRCVDCSEQNKNLLEFHHRDPSTKKGNVVGFTSMKATLREIEKCDVLCKDCHYKRHNKKVKCPCCGTHVAFEKITVV